MWILMKLTFIVRRAPTRYDSEYRLFPTITLFFLFFLKILKKDTLKFIYILNVKIEHANVFVKILVLKTADLREPCLYNKNKILNYSLKNIYTHFKMFNFPFFHFAGFQRRKWFYNLVYIMKRDMMLWKLDIKY